MSSRRAGAAPCGRQCALESMRRACAWHGTPIARITTFAGPATDGCSSAARTPTIASAKGSRAAHGAGASAAVETISRRSIPLWPTSARICLGRAVCRNPGRAAVHRRAFPISRTSVCAWLRRKRDDGIVSRGSAVARFVSAPRQGRRKTRQIGQFICL